jgi:hypothetical protein
MHRDRVATFDMTLKRCVPGLLSRPRIAAHEEKTPNKFRLQSSNPNIFVF